MLRTTKSVTLSGRSYVKDSNGDEKVALYISATVPDDGSNPNVNSNYADIQLYLDNINDCKKDREEFESIVDDIMKSNREASSTEPDTENEQENL